VCHSYEVHTDRFKRSRVFLKVESTPFDHGAMRQCYRAKLLVPSSQDTQDASPLLNPLADIPGCTPQMARLIAKKVDTACFCAVPCRVWDHTACNSCVFFLFAP